jgi:hypothetical protein
MNANLDSDEENAELGNKNKILKSSLSSSQNSDKRPDFKTLMDDYKHLKPKETNKDLFQKRRKGFYNHIIFISCII